MTPRPWLLLMVTGAACSPRPALSGPERCAPSTATPDPSASAAALVGDYRVRLVATTGPRRDSSADGRLTLSPVEAPAPGSRSPALVGTAELALEDVGAPAADLASADPARPGVVGFELEGAASAGSPRLMLRLGAEVNRTDVVRVEGASTVLRVREVRPEGFLGEWTANAPLPVAEGYFCAWRAGDGE